MTKIWQTRNCTFGIDYNTCNTQCPSFIPGPCGKWSELRLQSYKQNNLAVTTHMWQTQNVVHVSIYLCSTPVLLSVSIFLRVPVVCTTHVLTGYSLGRDSGVLHARSAGTALAPHGRDVITTRHAANFDSKTEQRKQGLLKTCWGCCFVHLCPAHIFWESQAPNPKSINF